MHSKDEEFMIGHMYLIDIKFQYYLFVSKIRSYLITKKKTKTFLEKNVKHL